MSGTLDLDRYSERTVRLLRFGVLTALGLTVWGVSVVAGERAGLLALVGLFALGKLAVGRYDPGTVDERDVHVHRAASARTLEIVGVVGGLAVAGALALDAFDVVAAPAWTSTAGYAVAGLLPVYGLARVYERYA